MKTLVVLCLLTLPLAAQKKPAATPESPKTYQKARTFAAPCDAVWPVALQTWLKSGWKVATSDKAGGVLTLDWIGGQDTRTDATKLVARYATDKTSGWWFQWRWFRIVSASVIVTAADSGCKYSVDATMHGNGLQQGSIVLTSRGLLESEMLDAVEAALK